MTEVLAPGVYRSGQIGQAPLLLLHSSQSNAGQWRALCKALQNEFDIINVDLLGYGQAPQVTDTANSFRFKAELPRIEAALEQAQIRKPLTIIGHSYGGALGLKLTVEQHFPISRAVLFEPVAFHLLEAGEAAHEEIAKVAAQMEDFSIAEATEAFVDYWNFPGFFAALPKKTQAGMIAQGHKVSLDFAALMGENYTLADCAEVTQPLLLLQGAGTRLSAQTVAAKLLQALPNAQTTTIQCGHMGPLTHSKEVNAEIIKFLCESVAE